MTTTTTKPPAVQRVARAVEIAETETLRVFTELDCRMSSRARSDAFVCPVCSFRGRFATAWAMTGRRKHAYCPNCRAAERHRLQALVLDRLRSEYDFARLDMLHVAPEPTFRARFAREFGSYTTSDLDRPDVDLRMDLTAIDLPDDSFDVVYASHVLEHIPDDHAALAEIARVLRPGGFAVLPVPIVCGATVEYPEPVAAEAWHVRAPGPDYFDRFTEFGRVDVYTSADFPEEHQTYVHEDRTRFPNRNSPYRTPSSGARHLDLVPVAFRA